MRLLFSIILCGYVLAGYCQESQDSAKSKGFIEVIADPRLDTLVNRYASIQKKKANIQGYRIQVIASPNRSAVYKVKAQFYNLFPDKKLYTVYNQPNFKLRVGNYRTKLEAYKDLQEINSHFTDAFIIRDEIKISEL